MVVDSSGHERTSRRILELALRKLESEGVEWPREISLDAMRRWILTEITRGGIGMVQRSSSGPVTQDVSSTPSTTVPDHYVDGIVRKIFGEVIDLIRIKKLRVANLQQKKKWSSSYAPHIAPRPSASSREDQRMHTPNIVSSRFHRENMQVLYNSHRDGAAARRRTTSV